MILSVPLFDKLARHSLAVVLAVASVTTPLPAQRITSPLQQFGHAIGDDYFLINYAQLVDYWQKLDRQSDRMTLERIGTTAEGRPMWMAIITSAENHRRLSRYREISERLARAETLNDEQAHALAREGKAIVWIDGGLHATEVLGAQQLVQFVYEMVSRNDPETQRFLKDVILLAVLVNPDGMDLVSNWYMRNPDPKKRSLSGVPRLYHKYAGHDNNRDSYMAALPETRAIDSILFRSWYPQIMYNHHQTGPAGSVLFAPPFRDPFNYNYDPLIPVAIDLVGAAIHNRFIAEGKPGATMRNGASFSTWWNGGLRTTVYFHNMIGLLTETFGSPTPSQIVLAPDRLLPSASTPYPILPQPWHFAQSLAYELSANRAVLDVASKYREDFLYNIYRMGRNSIERGSRDNWTLTPKLVTRVEEAAAKDSASNPRSWRQSTEKYVRLLHDPASRDARAYVIPSDQRDFATAVRFINALVKNGITIHRARAPLAINGRSYPAGSYVVLAAQAFRPHVLDMFEPQNHPDDIPYPGGPPTPPYDNAGWTLAYQMGVQFDRILDSFNAPLEKLTGFAPVPAGTVPSQPAAWYAWTRKTNDGFAALNRLLRSGEEVYTVTKSVPLGGQRLPQGAFVVRGGPSTLSRLRTLAKDRGVSFAAVSGAIETSELTKLRLPRIALWDEYGGSISSGWLRLIFEEFEFPYDSVFARDLDAGNLRQRYDVIVLPDEARLVSDTTARPPPTVNVPAEWQHRVGVISEEKTLPQLRRFVDDGGTLIALGSAARIAHQLQLRLTDAVVDSAGKPLPRARYYVPGSILKVAVDTTNPVAWGLPARVDVFFDNSPAFRFGAGASVAGMRRVAWFDSPSPLRSGWAWGARVLDGAVEIATAKLGRGDVILYGPEVYFRSQPHGAFRFLFNGIYYSQSGAR
ncbi:MAG TPA: M14 metallopeptidase family protein [Gemmatimonadaceae bacterium]